MRCFRKHPEVFNPYKKHHFFFRTSPDNALVAVLTDDDGRLQLQALISTESARLTLAKLAGVAERFRPAFVKLADLLGEFLLDGACARQEIPTKSRKISYLKV